MGRHLSIPEIGDVTPKAAAQRMGLTEERFREVFDNLVRRGFPRPDPDTGNFCIEAIDAWRRLRHAELLIDGIKPGCPALNSGALNASVVHARRKAKGREG